MASKQELRGEIASIIAGHAKPEARDGFDPFSERNEFEDAKRKVTKAGGDKGAPRDNGFAKPRSRRAQQQMAKAIPLYGRTLPKERSRQKFGIIDITN